MVRLLHWRKYVFPLLEVNQCEISYAINSTHKKTWHLCLHLIRLILHMSPEYVIKTNKAGCGCLYRHPTVKIKYSIFTTKTSCNDSLFTPRHARAALSLWSFFFLFFCLELLLKSISISLNPACRLSLIKENTGQNRVEGKFSCFHFPEQSGNIQLK